MKRAFILAIFLVAGCGSGGPSNQSEHAQGEEEEIVLPVDPRHLKPELTPQWLDGYWVGHKAACYGSDSGVHFAADGSYSEIDESGRYSIEGGSVRMTVTENHQVPDERIGYSETVTIEPVGPNEIDTGWTNEAGEPMRLYRCPEGGMPH